MGSEGNKTPGLTPESRAFRLARLQETSARLIDAAREGDWQTVGRLVHQQSSLLLDPEGRSLLNPSEEGLTDLEKGQAKEIQQNLAEVEQILNTERQNTAKRLEMVSKVRKIRNTYKPQAPQAPRLQDRTF